ncbi:MAG TPA: DMT family transporter [Gaiellaceae bacterium]|nr:DMT family transporter [Gaiellaceae bacterium]
MNRGYIPWLLLLAGLWGSSYFFIKVAVDDLEPAVMMCVRALVGGLLLLAFLVLTRGAAEATSQLRASGREMVVFGTFNAALPFWLIAWGEKHIDSSVAGVAQATVPIFAFVIGLRFLPHEHVAPIRWLGVALGLVGVLALTGLDLPGGWWAVAGTLAVVLSSVSYASSGTYAQLRVADVPGPVLATGGMLFGGLLLVPFALLQLPDEAPGWETVASVAALTVLGTTIAQLVYFHMLPLYGNRRISLVAYIMPVFAIAYGALFLSEEVTAGIVLGLGLILAGVALGSGIALASRRPKTAEEVL